MRKLKLFFACLLMAVLSIGQMWAGSATYSMTPDATTTGSSASSYQTNLEFTYDQITWKMDYINPSNRQTKTNQTSVTAQFYYHNTTAFPGKITKVVMTYNALTLKDETSTGFMFVGGSSAVTTTTGGTAATWNSTNKTMTWEPASTDNFTFFAFYMDGKRATGNNYLAASDAIVVTYEVSGGSCTSEITVTKAADPANGSFSLDNSGTVCIDEGNATVNVTATPADHYHLASVTSTVGTIGTISGNTCEITDIDADTEIGVTFAEDTKYVVTWNVNGNEDTKTNVYAGEKPVFPATPAACDATSTTFIGWAAAPWTGKLADLSEKTVYMSANAMPDVDAAVTYYAVFAKAGGSASELFSWAGGTKAGLTAAEGVAALTADNSDYAESHAPYRVKWNTDKMYIIISVASQPGKVSAGFKKIGGAGVSTITVQESTATDGTFTDVETLSIEGASNAIVSVETSSPFQSTTRAIKLVYNKQANVGLGPISIEGAVSMSDYMTTCSTPTVAKPTISGETSFLSSTEVTLAQAAADAIYYTIDNSTPTDASTPYSAPFTLTNSATVKAIAVKGGVSSAVAEETFTKVTVLTVAEARAAIDAGGDLSNKYVAGIISQIDSYNGTYHSITYWISDDGTTTDQLQVYSGLAGVVKTEFASKDDLAVGDDVTVNGTLKKYNSTYEFDKNNTVVAYKPIARLSWSAASYNADIDEPSSNVYPTLTNTNGVTVAYSSSNTDAATIDPATGDISLVAAGSTTITASFAGNSTYKANSVSYTLNVASSLVHATISFDVDGGTAIDPLTDKQEIVLAELPAAVKAGKNFGGWFKDVDKTVPVVAEPLAGDITLYAKWLEPYTVAEALAMIDAMSDNETAENSIYVQGIVCVAPEAAPNSGRLTYYISANGNPDPVSNQFQIYLGYGVSGANFTAQTDVQLEDAVVAFGKLKRYVKSAVVYPEFDKGSQLYSLVRKADPELAWSETSFDAYIGESNTFPMLTNDHNVAVTYSSTETDYATISNEEGHEGEITLVAVGTTTIKATFAGDEDYKAAEVSYTLNVYNPITAGTITYEENGGSEVADVETPVDNLPDPLPTPTKENNIFAGWWTTSTFEDGTQAVAGAPMNGNITLYAKWTAIPYYATVYTSNVGFVGGGDSHEANSKVSIAETEYDAQKVGSSSKGGTITVTVPAKTNTLHFHVFTWKNKSNQITVSGALTNLSASTIDVDGDDAGGGSGTYTIESNPVDHYRVITFDAVEAETEITFTSPASGEQRFIMYGINQEGGVYPVLDHIVITGEATELTYEIGDEFNPAGLGVNAIYTLEEVEQTPVAVDVDDIEWSFDPAYIAGETTSVTVTATYNEKSANKTVTGIIVNVPAPEILVNPASVAFGNVNQDDVVEAEVINVTLKSVENATIALSGDVAAFTLDKDALTANGTISVTPVTSVAGTFAATITISDDASVAESKEVALSMTVKAPEVPDVCDGTDDFATIDKTVSPTGYATRTTTDGWVGTNVRFQEIDEKMFWKINGKTTAVGTITSPVLSDGIATLKFRYANTDVESNGVSIKIEIKQSEAVVKEYTLTKANSEVTKDEIYTELIEDINVAGDFQIVITNLSPSSSTSNKDRVALGRFCWSSYSAAPEPPVENWEDGRTDLTQGKYYTICLPKKVTNFRGASIWNLEKRNTGGTEVYLEEAQLPFAAGTPFIIQATADKLEVVYEGDATETPVESGALRGTLTGLDVDAFAGLAGNIYILKDNAIRPRTTGNYLSANRAYIDYEELVPVSEAPTSMPGKKVKRMPMQGQTTTDCELINAAEAPVKMMINGQLFILRGEKMYDTTGRLVK